MTQNGNFTKLKGSNSYETNNSKLLSESLNTINFKENFSKIFDQKKNDEDFLNNELNFTNSNFLESKEGTFEQYRQRINGTEDDVSAPSSIFDTNTFVFNSNKEIDEKNIIFPPPDVLSIEENKNIYIGKKRKIFKINYMQHFSIFNKTCTFYKYNRIINDEVMNESKIETKSSENSGSGPKKRRKKVKNIEKRKENSDNIRKKIKSRFLRELKVIVNKKLKTASSKKKFKSLPQKFISTVTKNINKSVLDLTFKEIMTTNFEKILKTKKNDLKNYYHNISVLEYLEKNKKIMEESGFKFIKDMTFRQIYYEYLQSKEFEMEITNLKEKDKEKDKYIKDYIAKASNLINFFEN